MQKGSNLHGVCTDIRLNEGKEIYAGVLCCEQLFLFSPENKNSP